MYRDMRKIERQLDTSEADHILLNGEYGILSTVNEDGTPYGVPLSYAYADGIIYFHCAKDVGHKVDNLEHQPNACFTVVGSTEVLPAKFSTKYESVIAFGKVQKAADKLLGLRLLVEKYSPDFMEKGRVYAESSLETVAVYELVIDHMTAKGRR